MAAMNPNEAPKRSKRDRLRAKAGEIFHMKNGKDDDSTPTPAEAFSATDKEDLVKKAQDLLNKKKDQNGSEEMKETVGLVALGALGVLGPVAYEMWKRRKEKKKQQQRCGRSGEDNGEAACEEEVVEAEEAEEAESEEENDQGEEEEREEEGEGEGSSEYQDFLTWIPLAFHAQNAYTMANDGYRLAGLA